jgi:hypothetical protein
VFYTLLLSTNVTFFELVWGHFVRDSGNWD